MFSGISFNGDTSKVLFGSKLAHLMAGSGITADFKGIHRLLFINVAFLVGGAIGVSRNATGTAYIKRKGSVVINDEIKFDAQ